MFFSSPYVSNAVARPDQFHVDQLCAVMFFFAFYLCLRHVVLPPLSIRYCATYRDKFSPWERDQWLRRWITFLHCFPAVYLAYSAISAEPEPYWTSFSMVESFTWASQFAVANTCAYLVYDLVDLMVNFATHGEHDGGPLVYMHHICGILSCVNFYAYGKLGLMDFNIYNSKHVRIVEKLFDKKSQMSQTKNMIESLNH